MKNTIPIFVRSLWSMQYFFNILDKSAHCFETFRLYTYYHLCLLHISPFSFKSHVIVCYVRCVRQNKIDSCEVCVRPLHWNRKKQDFISNSSYCSWRPIMKIEWRHFVLCATHKSLLPNTLQKFRLFSRCHCPQDPRPLCISVIFHLLFWFFLQENFHRWSCGYLSLFFSSIESFSPYLWNSLYSPQRHANSK